MLKGLKTVLIGAGVALIGVLESADITAIIPDKYDELALAVVGVVMVVLRMVTNTPVGKKNV